MKEGGGRKWGKKGLRGTYICGGGGWMVREGREVDDRGGKSRVCLRERPPPLLVVSYMFISL